MRLSNSDLATLDGTSCCVAENRFIVIRRGYRFTVVLWKETVNRVLPSLAFRLRHVGSDHVEERPNPAPQNARRRADQGKEGNRLPAA